METNLVAAGAYVKASFVLVSPRNAIGGLKAWNFKKLKHKIKTKAKHVGHFG